MGISPNNPYVVSKYLGNIQNHIWSQVMLFKHMIIDKAFVQVWYIDIDNKGQLSGLKQLD